MLAHRSSSSHLPALAGLRVLVAAPDLAVLLLRAAALTAAGATVHAARTRAGAIECLRHAPPIDAAVIEIGLAGGALALEAQLRHGDPPCLSVVIGSANAETVRELLATGVVAHRAPPALPHTLVPVVARVAAATADRRTHRDRPAAPGDHASAGIEAAIQSLARRRGLSCRERSVLRYIALGYRYVEIGHYLRIKPRTVKMHAESLRRKTGTQSRRELLREVFDR